MSAPVSGGACMRTVRSGPGRVLSAVALLLTPVAAAAGQAAPTADPAEGVRIRAEVVSEPVEVGSVFEVELEVRHPPGAEAAPVLEAALGDFRVFGAAPLAGEEAATSPPEVPAGEGAAVSRFRVRLGALVLPGDHEIPPIPVGIRTAGGALALVESDPVPVRVISSLPPEPADVPAEGAEAIHDIRGPFSFSVPPRWGRIAVAAAAVLLLAAAVWFLVRLRAPAPAPVVPLPPPAVEAEAALAGLMRSGLLEAGRVVAFYERLGGIMKRYAGRRFRTRWNDRTTDEILSDLAVRAGDAHAGALPLLAGVLGEADLAKFSERSFRPEAARSRFTDAGRFLDRTRPPVREEEEGDEEPPAGGAAVGPEDADAAGNRSLPSGSGGGAEAARPGSGGR